MSLWDKEVGSNMFTIIVCTYNGKRTIKETIKHILEQKDYDRYVKQFIVVDNASTDETKEIVLRYAQSANVIYSYEEKPGLGNARLNGVKLTQEEWIVFVDDDNELDSDWITNAADFIKNNPDVGIFGGSIIPKLEFKATQEEYDHLRKHMGKLACTDYRREEIDFSRNTSPFRGIIGAGMVVKTEYLKELAEKGWINQIGRTGDNTAAGDDSEISLFVTEKKGRKAGYCPNMILEHNLPQSRLQSDYLLKLNESITIGCYKGQSLKKWYVLRRIKQLFLYGVQKNPYERDTLEFKMWEQGKDIYLRLTREDMLFLKKVYRKQERGTL